VLDSTVIEVLFFKTTGEPFGSTFWCRCWLLSFDHWFPWQHFPSPGGSFRNWSKSG